MPFYTFVQNNSGGKYYGPAHYVIVEARDADHANRIAKEDLDLYFNGVREGYDCSCCGDRWYPVDEYDVGDSPNVYDKDPAEAAKTDYVRSRNKCSVFVRYLDGSTKKY